jgi:hypothetical protein
MPARYQSTGCDRDSYISGVRPGGLHAHAPHDVSARRDTLPDNVFQYLKEQVTREQYDADRHEEARAALVINAGAKAGKRIAVGGDVALEMKSLEATQLLTSRHLDIKALYEREMASWSAQLAQRGLALSKD